MLRTWLGNGGNYSNPWYWTGFSLPGPGDLATVTNGYPVIGGQFSQMQLDGYTLSVGAPSNAGLNIYGTTLTLGQQFSLTTGPTGWNDWTTAHNAGIYLVNATLENKGAITVYGGTMGSSMNIDLRYSDFDNDGSVMAMGGSTFRVSGRAQYGTAGEMTNDGRIVASGSSINLDVPVSGDGVIMALDHSTVRLGHSFGDGGTIDISSGMLEFGPVNPSHDPGFARNPGMSFLGDVTGLTVDSSIMVDGVWDDGTNHRLALENITADSADLSMWVDSVPVLDVHLTGQQFAPQQFALGTPDGESARISFIPNPAGG